MELNKIHWIGIFIGVGIILFSFLLMGTPWFFFVGGLGLIFMSFPFVISSILETKRENEKEEMFLEFARNLVESVKAGSPISKSIINSKGKDYGVLNENVNKLANQISMGIPLSLALQTFAKDVDNKTISRALSLIGQAEKAGGDIGRILESVAEAVTTSDKLDKERKSVISTLVVQGYIIFAVFLIIILVMQFRIIPLIGGISNVQTSGSVPGIGQASIGAIDSQAIGQSFLFLLLVQGLFSGLAIGKLAEGRIKAGIKHSFILMISSFLVSSGANILLGGV